MSDNFFLHFAKKSRKHLHVKNKYYLCKCFSDKAHDSIPLPTMPCQDRRDIIATITNTNNDKRIH